MRGVLPVAVHGALGRMGTTVTRLVIEAQDLQLTGASEKEGHPDLGCDVGEKLGLGRRGVKLSSRLKEVIGKAKVVIDFTSPAATLALARVAAPAGKAMVIGTTGWKEEERKRLIGILSPVPAVLASNMSVGMNLLFRMVGEFARALGPGYDLEIVEAHHRRKKDAPSGTALELARQLAAATGRKLKDVVLYGRQGMTGERDPQTICIHAVRGGDTVGDHTVLFCGPGERVELRHRAESRATFAQGSLRAARFAATAKPGLYTMQDVLAFGGELQG